MEPTANDQPAGFSIKDNLKASKAKQGGASASEVPPQSFLQRVRTTVDALVFAYVLAMFIRTFAFELFMIPTGSMTPTLIGDSAREVVMIDYDKDGVDDVVYTLLRQGTPDALQIYLMKKDGGYKEQLFLRGVDPNIVRKLAMSSRGRTDMIVVNKFSYWFREPQRGDIAIFKVPNRPSPSSTTGSTFDPTKPVYIKRVLAEPGEVLTIRPPEVESFSINDPKRRGHLFGGIEFALTGRPVLINGQHLPNERIDPIVHFPPPAMDAELPWVAGKEFSYPTPEDSVMMVGDNAASSLDSRYWGGVPLDHMRGQAVLRFRPFNAFRFFE